MIVQVSLLVLCAQHVHNLSVLWCTCGALCLALSIALKAVLVKRVTTQEVYRRELEWAVAHAALGLLEYLGTVKAKTQIAFGCTIQSEPNHKASGPFQIFRAQFFKTI